MSHVPLRAHNAKLHAVVELLHDPPGDWAKKPGGVIGALSVAWQLLHDAQPGYPSGGDDVRSSSGISDRTGRLATAEVADFARRDLDDLDRLLSRIADDVVFVADIVRRWQPPSAKWREALSTEAAKNFVAKECRSCLRVGHHSYDLRSPGSLLCRWCEDWKRELGRKGDLPLWFVQIHANGRRPNSKEVQRARAEMKAKR